MFMGLSAFPLTPLDENGIDEMAFRRLLKRLASAKVDSIGVLGSTGSYVYLERSERRRMVELAVGHAEGIPVMAGIGALRTRDVLRLAEDAQEAGAAALLLAPVSYQPLTEGEVFTLYEQVSRNVSVPICVYDNPTTTRFHFTDDLHGRIARLPQVGSIKIPGVPQEHAEAKARVDKLRSMIPSHVAIGVSGDPFASAGLNAGCDGWYSVLGGLLPEICLAITRSALSGNTDAASSQSERLEPLWSLFRQNGSLRVIAAAAEQMGLIEGPGLPLPVKRLHEEAFGQLKDILRELELL